MEISSFNTGDANSRPGFYIESSIRAEEVMGRTVTMYIAWDLLSNYKNDPFVTQLLE